MQKLIHEVKLSSKGYMHVKSVSNFVEKLIANLEQKLTVMKDVAFTAHRIDCLRHDSPAKRSSFGTPRADSPASDLSPTRRRPLGRIQSNLSCGMDSMGSSSTEELADSMAISPWSAGDSSPNKRESHADLRKFVLQMNHSTNLQGSPIRPTRANSTRLQGEHDSQRTSDATERDSGPNSTRKAAMLKEIQEIVVSSLPTAWNYMDDMASLEKRLHYYSPVFPHRKPFDKTEVEELTEAIFSNFQKPPKRKTSLTHEPLHNHQPEPELDIDLDNKLDLSCRCDYATSECYYRETKHFRANSETVQAHQPDVSATEAEKPKK